MGSRDEQAAGRAPAKSGRSQLGKQATGALATTRNRSGGRGLSEADRRRYLIARLVEGKDLEEAARLVNRSKAWASAYERDEALEDAQQLGLDTGPKPREMLSGDAARALEDFGFFRHRYFGRRSVPWAEDVAQRIKEKLESPYREFGVVNIAPGVGKSTTFTHDLNAWITARDRTITGIIGSSTLRLAFPYIMRLRRSLEMTVPMKAKTHELEHGFAFDAEACMAVDFGPFRPLNPDVWRQDAFTVWQDAGVQSGEKESTWMAFAQGEQLGWRVRMIVWDDLVTRKTTLSAQETEKQRLFWDDECETRLEPGGLLLLQGQRLAPNDLYRYNLDKKADVDVFDFDSPDVAEAPKYFHIVYKAHYDEVCQVREGAPDFRERWEQFHSPKGLAAGGFDVDGTPTNGGCLLDPYRLPHRELSAHRRNNPQMFEVVYQQGDTVTEDVLVPAVMLEGGVDDKTGEHFPGCLDRTFSIGVPPRGLKTPRSVITVDPSGTKWWVLQWWLVDSAGYRWLGDLRRRRMKAPELLEWDVSRHRFTGVLEDWCVRARELGYPVTTVVVEQNAAQRYLLQYEFVRRWRAHQGVSIVGHETGMNKTDPEKGVWSIQKQFRAGMVRIPYADPSSRSTVEPFLTELKGYPYAETTDCVMAYWFLEYRLPAIRRVEGSGMGKINQHLPSWMRGRREDG
jgi:hypothetical protein